MIFKNKLLSSPYDLDQNKVETFSLTSLSKEIYNITQTIYGLYKSGEVIKVENGSKELYLDAGAIDDTVWFRSVPEIREILYRNRKSDGLYPIQFSLNKFLFQLGLKEPIDSKNNTEYLKLLYLFYIMHYFIFPHQNLFKNWKHQNFDFEQGYDDGALDAEPLHFLMNQLLSNFDALESYCLHHIAIDSMMNSLNGFIVENQRMPISIRDYEVSHTLIIQMLYLCDRYNICAYCQDLRKTLTSIVLEEIIPTPNVPPFPNWKYQYLRMEELDAFFMSNAFYWFCTQSTKNVASRERIKFAQNNAVKNLKQMIKNDRIWMENNQSGLLIEVIDKEEVIYALRAAIAVKTYWDIAKNSKLRLLIGKYKRSLSTLLLHPQRKVYHSLSERFFILMCHIEYDLMTKDIENYDVFYERITKETIFLNLIFAAYQQPSYEDCENFLRDILFNLS